MVELCHSCILLSMRQIAILSLDFKNTHFISAFELLPIFFPMATYNQLVYDLLLYTLREEKLSCILLLA